MLALLTRPGKRSRTDFLIAWRDKLKEKHSYLFSISYFFRSHIFLNWEEVRKDGVLYIAE